MSGSGAEPSGGAWGAGGTADDCDFEVASTQLRSTVPNVVSKLKKGDVLQVEVDEDLPAVLVKRGAEAAGSVVDRVPKFVACSKAGYKYEAEILEIDGAVVTVRTRPRP
jgi:hypothetical protein